MKRLIVHKNWTRWLDMVANGFEVVIALSLLVVIGAKLIEAAAAIVGSDLVIINMEFNSVLSTALSLVIGVEFVRMLCKHTPETVVDVLLFAIAREIIIYQDGMLEIILGVVVIAGLFGVKKFLIEKTET